MMRFRPRSLLLLPLLAVVACGDAPAVGGSTMDAPDHTVEVPLDPVYEVGGFDAPDWALFGNIISVAFDARGHLFLLDEQTSTVTEVDTAGDFVRTIGRVGEGPGELSGVQALAISPEGEIAVFDLGHQAWVVFGPDGQFRRNVRVDLMELGFPRGDVVSHPLDDAVLAPMSGRILSTTSADAEEDGPATRPVAWYSLVADSASRILYEAWDLPAVEIDQGASLELGGGGRVQFPMPVLRAFEPPLRTAVLPDGRVAVVDSVGYRIKLVETDGTVSGALERPVAPVAVTPGIQQAEKRRRAEEMAANQSGGGGMTIRVVGGSAGGGSTGGGPAGGGAAQTTAAQVDAGAVRRMMEGRLESMIFADEIPVIEAIAVDGYGRVWVQRSSAEPGEPGPTDLITTDGRYLGTLPPDGLRIPRAFGPGGLMVRQVTDEFDVQTLIVERLPAEIASP